MIVGALCYGEPMDVESLGYSEAFALLFACLVSRAELRRN